MRFPASTGDRILQERGWGSCCVRDEQSTAQTRGGLKRKRSSSSGRRRADELSLDPGPRRPLQFQALGPLLACGRSVSSLVAPKHTKYRSFCPNRVLRALLSFPLTSSAVPQVSPHDYGRITFCPFSWERTRTSHLRFYCLNLRCKN